MKKILVIGIVFILLFAATPTMLGQTIQKENQTLNNSNITSSGDAKPDFKIVDIGVEYDEWGWPAFNIFIENLGASVTWNGECSFTFKRISKNESIYGSSSHWGEGRNHPTGETFAQGIWFYPDVYLPYRTFCRVYFLVDPNNNVEESNEANNAAWTYAYIVYSNPLPRIMNCRVYLGQLRQGHIPGYISQQSTTQSNVLLQGTETTNNVLLLRLLEQFPLLERFLNLII